MKNPKLFIVLFFFVTMGLAFPSNAQEEKNSGMFFIIEEFVAPDKLAKFWTAQNEVLKVYDEMGVNMTFNAFRTDQNSFFWAIPIENFASIDEIFELAVKNHKGMMEKGIDPSEKFRGLSTMSHFVVKWNEELSYHPEGMEQDESNVFYEWMFCYLKSGHEKEAAAACKKYMEFYDSIDETFSWDIFEVVLGEQAPCWIIAFNDESEAAMRATEADLQKKYGNEFQKLWFEMAKHMENTSIQKGWYMPDWSRSLEE